VAKSLVESPQAIERGLVQRFLWIFPKLTYSKFAKLQTANQSFVEYISKFSENTYNCSLYAKVIKQACQCSK